ncbi:hypothetical protein [Herbaspirillum rubrisubalbicans]|uniref:Outer envelope protein n=1 Tax=Herbaspirillum rubrisubalbicans TaxID=80842 RepID=A0AAD0UCP1_9BURK|nr:hypothetical protein [Herbaspirillum rubrisubalbicans]ALU91333.1 hypothetical protein Hrubri_4186 [Herbaspirillum rubrisubalbicans M1]AYR26356.1 outer envelope protein [Herbaspirillum rubrisubalbicans]
MKKGIKGKYWMMAAVVASAASSMSAHALDWADNSIGYRYGTRFAEPFNSQDISKNIINFQHASGYQYGTNFLNIDMLLSDHKDDNAREFYVVYRNTLDIGKISGKDLSFGPARGVGLTLGFDWNTKNDNSYASKKRMWVVGPTLMMDVPGFLNVSVLALFESNKPIGVTGRYTYDTHPMLNLSWGIPLGGSGWAFEGYMNYIASKGKNEFGGPTSPEVNFDGELMYDLGTTMGMTKNKLRVGLEYQYWRNKFGNPNTVPGSLAKTPMVRAEYHF